MMDRISDQKTRRKVRRVKVKEMKPKEESVGLSLMSGLRVGTNDCGCEGDGSKCGLSGKRDAHVDVIIVHDTVSCSRSQQSPCIYVVREGKISK